ncbi:MAG: phosphoribosylanthranilate isomerase [Vicinamibacterales bacterium]
MFLKICGITRLADALHAAEQGATALGFLLWRGSPRYVTPEQVGEIVAELPPGVQAVGVFVNEPVKEIQRIARIARITAVQLHGDETPDHAAAIALPILRAVSIEMAAKEARAWPAETLLLLDAVDPDLRGGTGMRIDWTRAAERARASRIVLAGGLTPDNVEGAISIVQPFGVDVSSGVESAPGVKDSTKVARFLQNARAAFDRTHVATDRRG